VRQTPDATSSNYDAKPVDTAPLCEGRFVPFARLGRGSQGETLEAVDRKDGQLVAIKRFDVRGATSWKDVELAEREARVLSTLNHPGLANYVHHFEQDGSLYLAMQRIQGEDLAHLLATGKRFSFEELLELLEELSAIFSYLHGRAPAIVHRDVKPSNLIKRTAGGYALLDFGSVRDGLRPEGGSTVVGTFGYMAPEQFQGRALPASDLYGLGATLLTLITGSPPERLPHRGLEIDVRAAIAGTAPEPWIQLLERLVAADPDKRAGSLVPWLDSIRATTQRQPKAAAPPPPHASCRSKFNDANQVHSVPTQPPQGNHDRVFAAGTSVPFFFIVALQLVRIAIYVALQVALPILLTLLSLLFGRALRQAAADVSHAARSADQHLNQILSQLSHSGPLVASRATGSGRARARATTRGRRMRVGNFDLEQPDDSDVEERRRARRSR
jgi:serine/threonine protein kinase